MADSLQQPKNHVAAGDVIPIGEGLFWVGSSSKDLPHTVDPAAFEGVGSCECEHFVFRLEPILRAGFRGDYLRCSHIERVREHIADTYVRHEIKRRKEKANEPRYIKHPRNR